MLTLKIETENSAFYDEHDNYTPEETANILRDLADKLDRSTGCSASWSLFDSNGNRVGMAEYTES